MMVRLVECKEEKGGPAQARRRTKHIKPAKNNGGG